MSDGTASPSLRTYRHHPGARRRRARPYFPKGRTAAPEAVDEIRRLLGDRPRRRDLLIEHLHLMQDSFGHLSAPHLAALAAEMRLSLAEVYEVATFYAHFDVVKEGESPPPALTVRVCDGLSCALRGAGRLLATLQARAGSDVRIVRAPCMGRCEAAPAAEVGRRHLAPAGVRGIEALIEAGDPAPERPHYRDLATYRAAGGYGVLASLLAGKRSREEVIGAIEESGLRGLGGAGFPAARKWRFVAAEPAPRLLAVNADEGEPGTFKDRYLLETDPHRVIEGALIAAFAVEAEALYVYLRDEYPHLHAVLADEIAALGAAGLGALPEIHLRRGAGAYICGEESAMLESIEGKRGLPRHRPPYPAQVGLFGRPTLIHNVETLYWLPEILEKGAPWYADQGRRGAKGVRAFSVSGRVKEPGVKIAPNGVTARELVEEFSGGMAEGHVFTAYLPGGASGGILPARLADLPLDFGALDAYGAFVGSGALIVLSDHDDVRAAALNLLRFFEDESCGQCTPCRVGCEKAVALMAAGSWDTALLRELSAVMMDASICGLGQAAPNPILSVLEHFPEALR